MRKGRLFKYGTGGMRVYTPDFPLPNGYLWQYNFLVWLQSYATPDLDKVAKWLSMVGLENVYMVVLPIVFWSIHRTVGLRLAYVFLASMYSNEWLKQVTKIVRPIGVPGIRSLYTESSNGIYSLPSGHAQGPMTFWVIIGKWIRQKWFWPLALLLVLAIGLSRLYLGLHWPIDVLIGWGLGLLFGVCGWWMGKWWTYRAFAFKIRMTFALLLPGALLLVHRGSASAEYAALLLGLGVGALLEEKYLGTDMDPAIWKRVCASVIGIAGLIALKWIIKWPPDTIWLVSRDVLMGLWGTLGAPYVFQLCGVYRRGETSA